MNLMMLCKVVDNYGDIGFVWRLARSIFKNLREDNEITIVVSDLVSFGKMADFVDLNAEIQEHDFSPMNKIDGQDNFSEKHKNIAKIVCWDLSESSAAEAISNLKKNPPQIILECFQCNRPQWLDDYLDDKSRTREIKILNIDYLTAEEYADDFHLLQSGTRFSKVKKYFFMPGFTDKTGGLILDGVPRLSSENSDSDSNSFTVTIFSYPQDFSPVVKALSSFQKISGKKVKARVASGKSEEPFVKAWENENRPFEIEILPFLQQQQWDEIVYASDFNFIRGEDSLTRGCLCGVPFLWHAYPQDDDYQLVKTQALLEKIFAEDESAPQNASNAKNASHNAPAAENADCTHNASASAPEIFKSLFQNYNVLKRDASLSEKIQKELLETLLNYDALLPAFRNFKNRLIENGNFTDKLLEFFHNF